LRLAPLALAACLLLIGGCSLFVPPPQIRGNRVSEDQLKELVPGTSTKTDVVAELGSPTTHSSFDDNKWIYIGQVTRPRIAQIQAVESQDVVVLTFNDRGVLSGIDHLTQKDAKPVDVVDRTTPSPGTNASFFQQLFGNVGRFNPIAGQSAGAGLANGSPF
jgi:outer membrane protein assembly factor BamE (lipoprotein component of BamABCDE complex)